MHGIRKRSKSGCDTFHTIPWTYVGFRSRYSFNIDLGMVYHEYYHLIHFSYTLDSFGALNLGTSADTLNSFLTPGTGASLWVNTPLRQGVQCTNKHIMYYIWVSQKSML